MKKPEAGSITWKGWAMGGIIVAALTYGWKGALLVAASSWRWEPVVPGSEKGE